MRALPKSLSSELLTANMKSKREAGISSWFDSTKVEPELTETKPGRDHKSVAMAQNFIMTLRPL